VVNSVPYAASGAEAILRPLLADRTVTVLNSFKSNPKLPKVQACEAIDVAKLANNPRRLTPEGLCGLLQ